MIYVCYFGDNTSEWPILNGDMVLLKVIKEKPVWNRAIAYNLKK